jgi:hypothetical protein
MEWNGHKVGFFSGKSVFTEFDQDEDHRVDLGSF